MSTETDEKRERRKVQICNCHDCKRIQFWKNKFCKKLVIIHYLQKLFVALNNILQLQSHSA